MPYLKRKDKDLVDAGATPSTSGELNYKITMTALDYLQHKPLNYATLNEIYGAMQLAAAEFKRRLIDPYENRKIAENGDVYPPSLLAKLYFTEYNIHHAMADGEGVS